MKEKTAVTMKRARIADYEDCPMFKCEVCGEEWSFEEVEQCEHCGKVVCCDCWNHSLECCDGCSGAVNADIDATIESDACMRTEVGLGRFN